VKSDHFEPGFILVLPRIKGITLSVTEKMVETKAFGGNWKRNIMVWDVSLEDRGWVYICSYANTR
jgi:hypothetical protein